MNKRRREHPPWNERVFAPPEQKKIEATLREMLAAGEIARARRRTPRAP